MLAFYLRTPHFSGATGAHHSGQTRVILCLEPGGAAVNSLRESEGCRLSGIDAAHERVQFRVRDASQMTASRAR